MDLNNDVLFTDGQDNMAGIKKRAFIGFESTLTLAVPAANPATYAERVTISEDHELKTGKKLIELYVMYDKSGVESPLAGQRKGKSFKPKMTLVYPGTDAAAIGFMDAIMNGDLIVFAEPLDGDYLIQLGTSDLPAYLDAGSIKTGTTPDGEKGTQFEIVASSKKAWYCYTGTLPRVGA